MRYTLDVMLACIDEIACVQVGESIPASVAEDAFTRQLEMLGDLRLRSLSDPIRVTGKTAGFAIRLEGATEDRDWVGLLCYQGEKSWLHFYALDPEMAPNPSASASSLQPASVVELNAAWTALDTPAVTQLRQQGAMAWREEDLAAVLSGVGASPMSREEQGRCRGASGPMAVGAPIQLGNPVLLAWRWEACDCPNGFGERLLQYDGDRIAPDLRFPLRPWVATGGTLLGGP